MLLGLQGLQEVKKIQCMASGVVEQLADLLRSDDHRNHIKAAKESTKEDFKAAVLDLMNLDPQLDANWCAQIGRFGISFSGYYLGYIGGFEFYFSISIDGMLHYPSQYGFEFDNHDNLEAIFAGIDGWLSILCSDLKKLLQS